VQAAKQTSGWSFIALGIGLLVVAAIAFGISSTGSTWSTRYFVIFLPGGVVAIIIGVVKLFRHRT